MIKLENKTLNGSLYPYYNDLISVNVFVNITHRKSALLRKDIVRKILLKCNLIFVWLLQKPKRKSY